VIDSSRRAIMVRGAIAAIALVGPFARRATAGPGPSDSQSAPGDSYDAYCGNYRVDDVRVIGIDRFVLEDSGETTLLISDYQSGVVRRLFPVSTTDFVMGPGFDIPSPAELHIRFVTNEDGDAAAISVQPAAGLASVAERIPLKQEGVSFAGEHATLAGTLFLPASKGPHPAIILLHGSGPLTRYSFGPYPHFFTSLGMAVLIYDKRGTGASTGTRMEIASADALAQLPATYYPDELAKDALGALRLLRGRQEINPRKIGFWGSSEGGMLGTQVAARSKEVAFVINSSGFMGPLWQTLLYQVEATMRADGAPRSDISQALAFTRLWLRVAQTGEDYELYQQQRRAVQNDKRRWLFWWNDGFTSLEQMRWVWEHLLRFDPLPALKQLTCPVLGVFGELDLSTDAAAAATNMRHALSEAGRKDFAIKIFSEAGHSLAEMPSGNRMAPGVFDALRLWLLARI
jgi:pimeloyl-ACP methyl ester carboxylesterase